MVRGNVSEGSAGGARGTETHTTDEATRGRKERQHGVQEQESGGERGERQLEGREATEVEPNQQAAARPRADTTARRLRFQDAG